MATVATLDVKIGADLKEFQRGMNNLQQGLDRAGKQMRSVGKTLSMGLTAPLVALGAKSLQVFNQQQQALAQVESAVRSTGGAAGFAVEELARQASALQANTIFGDEEILKNVTANLLTFTRITGDEFTKTQGLVLDLATRMGTDLTSATIQLGKALNDPVANLGALGRAGIQFTKEQKEVIKSLVEGGKQAEAQRIILDELEVQFGGAAEAAAQAGLGGFKQLQNSVGDLLESFGELMLPIVNDVVEVLRNVVDRLQAMSPEAKKTALAVVGLAAAIGPALFILGGMAAGFSAIITAMGSLAALANPVVMAFAAIAAIAIAVYRNWEGVTSAFNGTYTAITNLVTNLKDNFVSTMSGIFKAVSLAMERDFSGAWETLKKTATGGASAIVTDLGTFATDAGAAVAPLATALVTDPFQIGDFFGEGVVGEITSAVTGIKGGIKSGLDTDVDSVKNTADKAKKSLESIRTEVGNVEALNPSFALIKTALGGAKLSASDLNGAFASILTSVNDVDLLAPAFATIKSALYDTEVDADELEAAFTAIETAVGDADLLAPAFATIKSGLGTAEVDADDLKGAFDDITAAVNSTDILAPSFATIKSALLGAEVNADDLEAAFTAIETAVGDADLLNPSFALLKTGLSGAELSAGSVKTALANIATEISGVEGKLPDFSNIIKALSGTAPTDNSLTLAAGNVVLGVKGVKDDVIALEKVAPDFSNIRLALDGDANSIKDSADQASDSIGGIFSLIPTELTLPEGYDDIINVIPDANETHRWGLYVTGMENLATHLSNAKGNAFNVSRYMRDIGGALDTLGIGPDKPFGKFISNVTQAALDVTTIIGGFEALAELLKAETWTSILKDALKLITGIVTGIGQILSVGGGGGGTVTNPNVATGAAAQGAGGVTTTAGGSGAGIGLLGGATVGATFGIFAYGLGQMLNDAITSLIEQGVDPAQLGTATSLGGLFQGLGNIGSGGTLDLSGLQTYMNTGGSNVSGDMATMGSTQTININLDGQQIATATVPYMAGELELYGTNY